MNKSKVSDIVIFGASGDLALRKLMPSLYHLGDDGHIADGSRIIAVSREDITVEVYCEHMSQRFQMEFSEGVYNEEVFQNFIKSIEYLRIDLTVEEDYKALSDLLSGYEDRERINYLSTAPSLFGIICENLNKQKLITANSRVVLEKPIGNDLKSSQVINDKVAAHFVESAIFRIDHYLGKDTVQNILALRFSNMLFAPIWNAQYIDHIQITIAESVGLEGRWAYYNDYGAMRDMVQNHMLQLLCLVTMEPPSTLDGDNVRDEKLKVIRSLRSIEGSDLKLKTVRGQYAAGVSGQKAVPGFLEEDGGNSNSDTETFVAIRADIDNWRWNGVPIYLRTGKRLREKYSEIVVDFKDVPHSIFPKGGVCIDSNKLVIRLQPDESISMFIMNKIPGLNEGMRLQQVELDLNIAKNEPRRPSAYEHLLLDLLYNNNTLFMRRDEVEAAWVWADKIIEGWKENGITPKKYTAGTDGPSSSIALIERDGRSWYEK